MITIIRMARERTSVKVKLLADGSDVADSEVTLNADNNWTNTWNDIPLKSGGKDITYTVEETSNVPGYKAEVTGDVKTGFTVTNSHTPETIDIRWNKDLE